LPRFGFLICVCVRSYSHAWRYPMSWDHDHRDPIAPDGIVKLAATKVVEIATAADVPRDRYVMLVEIGRRT
jgi:hypothetical protein